MPKQIKVVYSNKRLITPSHVTTHARKTLMAIGRSDTWRFAFMQAWLRFAAI